MEYSLGTMRIWLRVLLSTRGWQANLTEQYSTLQWLWEPRWDRWPGDHPRPGIWEEEGRGGEEGGSGKGKGVWELGVWTKPSVGPESVAIICRRSSHSYEQCIQSRCGSQDGLALTSHAPVDGVHAVIVEEVCAGRLQGRQGQGWPSELAAAASLQPLPTSRKWPQRSLGLKSQ